jgi:hypothetical protein
MIEVAVFVYLSGFAYPHSKEDRLDDRTYRSFIYFWGD